MADRGFVYTPDIDLKIPQAIDHALHTSVKSFTKIPEGEFNHVYKVVTAHNTIVIKVFRLGDYPKPGKLEQIEQLLNQANFPHAKLLYLTRSSDLFPYGFVITEFIEGELAKSAILSKRLSFVDFHTQLTKLLNNLHQISGTDFEGHPTLLGFLTSFVTSKLHDFKPDLLSQVIHKITDLVSSLDSQVSPVLVHHDPSPSNCIYIPDHQLVLIDWDGASFNSWLRDYAWLTYFARIKEVRSKAERVAIIKSAWVSHHDPQGLTSDQITQLEAAFHLAFASDLLQYYHNFNPNADGYKITQERINSILYDQTPKS